VLSPSSFKSELLQYRTRASADREVIARWCQDARAENLWKSLQKATGGALKAADFIKIVLEARRSAQASVNRVYGAEIKGVPRVPGFNEASAYALQALKEELKLVPDALPSTLLEAADFLEGGADFFEEKAQYFRNLHKSYLRHSDHLGLPDGPKFKLSRKDQSGSRVRKLFTQITSEWLSTRCGGRMDDAVATLTEIAFPGKQISADDVASIRKNRTKLKH
jgi:hypothetical protein